MPEQQPRIEREKIKHRRPNDLLFDDVEPTRARRSLAEDVAGHDAADEQAIYEDAADDWTREDHPEVEATSSWDEEVEDDWVLHGEDDLPPESDDLAEDAYQDGGFEEIYEEEDDGGVVWEDETVDDQVGFEHPDEIAFGQQKESFGFAPEVELAGRRDVRPKPPKPAPPPRPPGSRRNVSPNKARGRRQHAAWDTDDQPDLNTTDLGARRNVREPRARHDAPMPRAAGSHAEGGRFSRTRATMGPANGRLDAGSDEQVLSQSRHGSAKRRRQAQALPSPNRPTPPKNMPARDRYGAIRGRKGRAKGLVTVLLLALLAGGGWYGYSTIGSEGFQPTIDRLKAFIPLPGSPRTAADTPFGEEQPTDAQSAEQALSDLEQRVRQKSGGGLEAGQPNPQAATENGPPIPEFKPLQPGATRSLSANTPDAATDQAQLAAGDGDDGGEPSIFEQLWQFLRPG